MATLPHSTPATAALKAEAPASNPEANVSFRANRIDNVKEHHFYDDWAISKTLTRGDDHQFDQAWDGEEVVIEIRSALEHIQTFLEHYRPEISLAARILLHAKITSLNHRFHPSIRCCKPTSYRQHFAYLLFFVLNAILLSLILFCLGLPLVISFSKNDPDYWVIAIPNRLLLLIQTAHVCVHFAGPRVLWDLFVVRLLGQPLFYALLFVRWQYGFLDEPLRDIRYLAVAGLVNLATQIIVTYPVTLLVDALKFLGTHVSSRGAQKDAKDIHAEITKILPRLDAFLIRFDLSRWGEKELRFSKFDLKVIQKIMLFSMSAIDREQSDDAERITFGEVRSVFMLWKRVDGRRLGDVRKKIAAFLTTSTIVNVLSTIAFAHSDTAFTQNLFFTFYMLVTQTYDCFDTTASVREMGTTFCLQGGGQLVVLASGILILFTRPFGVNVFSNLPCSITFAILGTLFLLTYAEPLMQWQKGWWYRRGVIPDAEGRYKREAEARGC